MAVGAAVARVVRVRRTVARRKHLAGVVVVVNEVVPAQEPSGERGVASVNAHVEHGHDLARTLRDGVRLAEMNLRRGPLRHELRRAADLPRVPHLPGVADLPRVAAPFGRPFGEVRLGELHARRRVRLEVCGLQLRVLAVRDSQMVDRARAELLDELKVVLLRDCLKVCRVEELDVNFVRDVRVCAVGAGA